MSCLGRKAGHLGPVGKAVEGEGVIVRVGGIVRLNEEAVAVEHGAAVFILGGRRMPSAVCRSKVIVQLIPTFCCRQA